MKQAVLVVSFGTSYLETLEKNIAAIENVIREALPQYELRRAFTSSVIMRKLRSRDGMEIDNVPQALTRLMDEKFEKVVIQPTHMINGEEYDKLCAMAAPFRDLMDITIGTPLLTTVEDYMNMVKAITESMEAPAEDEAIVFMGHGTAHYANATYALLDYIFHDLGWDRVFVGTVEGYPELTQVVKHLKAKPEIKKLRVHPLMVVAGDHATNDMAGPEEDSWKSQLEKEGYQVSCILRGMGEYPAVRQLFAQHAAQAADKN